MMHANILRSTMYTVIVALQVSYTIYLQAYIKYLHNIKCTSMHALEVPKCPLCLTMQLYSVNIIVIHFIVCIASSIKIIMICIVRTPVSSMSISDVAGIGAISFPTLMID